MRNYELLKKIWNIIHINQARPETKVLTIENLLKRERPELKSDSDSVDAKEIERHVGLEIGPDGTVNSIIGNNYSGLD